MPHENIKMITHESTYVDMVAENIKALVPKGESAFFCIEDGNGSKELPKKGLYIISSFSSMTTDYKRQYHYLGPTREITFPWIVDFAKNLWPQWKLEILEIAAPAGYEVTLINKSYYEHGYFAKSEKINHVFIGSSFRDAWDFLKIDRCEDVIGLINDLTKYDWLDGVVNLADIQSKVCATRLNANDTLPF